MNGLSLCSGIGGIDLGLYLAVPSYRTACYVEIEPFCQDILLARMADGVLDRAPIWGDIKCFDGSPWRGLVDVVHGGYPCQPFSTAGKRGGPSDPRYLWPNFARIIAEIRPKYCFLENVSGHLTLGFDRVVSELEYRGYEVAAGLFTAAEVGAPQRRQRLFILARSTSLAEPQRTRMEGQVAAKNPSQVGPWGWRGQADLQRIAYNPFIDGARWPKPLIRGMDDGVPHRMDRLKALGNAVVPAVAALAWRTLYGELNG